MSNIVENVPPHLQPAATAALAWINDQRGANYKLTGLVDPDLDWQPESGAATEMGLVLCEDELCAREQVRVEAHGSEFQISLIDLEAPEIPPHLDPPEGVRAGWLNDKLSKHGFVVILFYRGFW